MRGGIVALLLVPLLAGCVSEAEVNGYARTLEGLPPAGTTLTAQGFAKIDGFGILSQEGPTGFHAMDDGTVLLVGAALGGTVAQGDLTMETPRGPAAIRFAADGKLLDARPLPLAPMAMASDGKHVWIAGHALRDGGPGRALDEPVVARLDAAMEIDWVRRGQADGTVSIGDVAIAGGHVATTLAVHNATLRWDDVTAEGTMLLRLDAQGQTMHAIDLGYASPLNALWLDEMGTHVWGDLSGHGRHDTLMRKHLFSADGTHVESLTTDLRNSKFVEAGPEGAVSWGAWFEWTWPAAGVPPLGPDKLSFILVDEDGHLVHGYWRPLDEPGTLRGTPVLAPHNDGWLAQWCRQGQCHFDHLTADGSQTWTVRVDDPTIFAGRIEPILWGPEPWGVVSRFPEGVEIVRLV